MKKVLLATTALALSAGVAYAEVSLSGSARMGLVHTGKVAGKAAVQGAVTQAELDAINTKHTTSLTGVTAATTTAQLATLQGNVTAAQNVRVQTLAGTVGGVTIANNSTLADVRKAIAERRAIAQTAQDSTTLTALADLDADIAEALDHASVNAAADLAAAAAGTAAVAATEATTRMEYRTRISLTGSGETDSGLAYSGTIRLQDSSTAPSVQAIGVTVSGAFGSLTFGSSSSAAEYAVGDIAGVGYTGAGSGNETSFLTGAFAMYSYTAGSVTVYASAGQIDSDDYSIGASFSSNGMTVGAGYEDNGLVEATSVSAAYAMGDTKVKVVYMDSDVVGKETGVSVASTMGAVSVAAYYKSTDPVLAAAASVNNYGVGASYDLGGGAAIKGGIAKLGKQTRADLGMTFSF